VVSALLVKSLELDEYNKGFGSDGFHWCRCTSPGAFFLYCFHHGTKLRAAEKAKSGCLHFFDGSSDTGHLMTFLRMRFYGFPFCFLLSGFSARHFGQSDGRVRHKISLFIGCSVSSFPGTDIWLLHTTIGPEIQQLCPPCTTIQLVLSSLLHQTIEFSAISPFETVSTSSSIVFSRLNRNRKHKKPQPQFRDRPFTFAVRDSLTNSNFPTCLFEFECHDTCQFQPIFLPPWTERLRCCDLNSVHK